MEIGGGSRGQLVEPSVLDRHAVIFLLPRVDIHGYTYRLTVGHSDTYGLRQNHGLGNNGRTGLENTSSSSKKE